MRPVLSVQLLERIFRLRHGLNNPKIVPFAIDGLVEGLPINVGFVTVCTGNFAASIPDVIESSIISGIENKHYDVIIAPEYSFASRIGIYSEQEKDSILERLVKVSAGKVALVLPGTFLWQKDGALYNTAYAISNGRVLHTYHKIKPGGEMRIAYESGLKFKQGDKIEEFHWMGFKVGLEICADAGKLAEHKINDCDLHVLIACGETSTKHCGKYVLVNDGCFPFISVHKDGKQVFPETECV